MARAWPSEDAALRRVEVLIAQRGIWTGVRRTADGWVLLHDPDHGDAS